MKRYFPTTDNQNSSSLESDNHEEKRTKIEEIYNFTNISDDADVMGCILDFLPLQDLLQFRMVSKLWNELIESERVSLFHGIKNVIDFCLASWKDERNDELLLSLLKWLRGKAKSIQLSKQHAKYFVDSKDPLVVDRFPCMAIISSTDGWVRDASYYEIMLHISEKIKIRMHFHLSQREDEIIYLNVEQNDDPTFDWTPFKIDPTTKNTLVHYVERTSSLIEKYSQNSHFFIQLGQLFGHHEEEYNPATFHDQIIESLFRNIIRYYSDGEQKEIIDKLPPRIIQYKYSDELREKLFQKPFSKKVSNSIILNTMEMIISNIHRSLCVNKAASIANQDSIVMMNDVSGRACSHRFRIDLHSIMSKFKLVFNNKKVLECELNVEERFYYGHDGYEGEHSFRMFDRETGKSYYIGGFAYGTYETVVWYDEENMKVLKELGLDEHYGDVMLFIEFIVDSLIEKLPTFDLFYGVSRMDTRSLRRFLVGELV